MFPNRLLSMCCMFFNYSPCTEELLFSLPVGVLLNAPNLQTYTRTDILFSVFIRLLVYLCAIVYAFKNKSCLLEVVEALIQQALMFV